MSDSQELRVQGVTLAIVIWIQNIVKGRLQSLLRMSVIVFAWGLHRKLGISVYTRSSLISGNNTRIVFFTSEGVKLEVSKIYWAFLSDNPSNNEYHASRDASKVYQSLSIFSIVFLDGERAISVCVSPWPWYTYILKLLLKVFKKRIQERLDISPNIAAIHSLHCGSFSEIACWSPSIEVLMTIKFSLFTIYLLFSIF
jgi:hypothetical protein